MYWHPAPFYCPRCDAETMMEIYRGLREQEFQCAICGVVRRDIPKRTTYPMGWAGSTWDTNLTETQIMILYERIMKEIPKK